MHLPYSSCHSTSHAPFSPWLAVLSIPRSHSLKLHELYEAARPSLDVVAARVKGHTLAYNRHLALDLPCGTTSNPHLVEGKHTRPQLTSPLPHTRHLATDLACLACTMPLHLPGDCQTYAIQLAAVTTRECHGLMLSPPPAPYTHHIAAVSRKAPSDGRQPRPTRRCVCEVDELWGLVRGLSYSQVAPHAQRLALLTLKHLLPRRPHRCLDAKLPHFVTASRLETSPGSPTGAH